MHPPWFPSSDQLGWISLQVLATPSSCLRVRKEHRFGPLGQNYSSLGACLHAALSAEEMARPGLPWCLTRPHHGHPHTLQVLVSGRKAALNSYLAGLPPPVPSLKAPSLGDKPPASSWSQLEPQAEASTFTLHIAVKGATDSLRQSLTNRRGRGMLVRAWRAPHKSAETCEEFSSSWGWGREGRNVTRKPSTLSFPLKNPKSRPLPTSTTSFL